MNFILLSKSWKEFFTDVLRNPQGYLIWVIVFLIVLFILSRLRNRMEERGVNKAIYISRGLVGSFIAFIVTPIVFYLLLNAVALVHGVQLIDVSFLTDWIGLTISSYWWLLECFFNSVSVAYAKEIYSIDSIIRILWIVLPVCFIWLRMSKSRMGKLFLIPLIIFVLVITRYKSAPPTFITQDKELIQKIPMIQWLAPHEEMHNPEQEQIITLQQRSVLALGCAALLLVGFVIGLYFKKRLAGILICLVGLLGFVLMAPHSKEKTNQNHPHFQVDLNALITKMDSLYMADGESIEVYELSQLIESVYDKRIAAGEMLIFPDSLCQKYEVYFYDRCQE